MFATHSREMRFGDRWSPSFARRSPEHYGPTNEVTIDRAAAYHENKRPYTVVLLEHGKPTHSIVVSPGTKVCAVTFLDQFLRDYLIYDFRELAAGRLFLTEVRHTEYRGVTDEKVTVEFTKFSPDGKTRVEKVDVVTRERKAAEFASDVSSNWEAAPQFGQFEGIIRKER